MAHNNRRNVYRRTFFFISLSLVRFVFIWLCYGGTHGACA